RNAVAITGTAKSPAAESDKANYFRVRFSNAMDDDFNTPEALAVLFELIKEINKAPKESTELVVLLKELGMKLGLLQQPPEQFLQGAYGQNISTEEVEGLIAARNAARAAKDWSKADQLRDELLENGILLDDGKNGTTWRRQST
ncbi:MAG: cysteine--tRNA ligase, partial [Pseudomonadales bacterium]|nr:cysteine--tRNA ligase [Pseudomonadales bacterium]